MSLGACWELLTCPVCRALLFTADRSLRCNQNHTFDRAREGYVNLLTAGHGSSKLRGDTVEMLRARRRTIDRGYFEPLSSRLNQLAAQLLGVERAARTTILDAGCGEGNYIGKMSESLASHLPNDCCFLGMDLSRDAARMAARRFRSLVFFVGDLKHRIQLQDNSVGLLLNVFAPRNVREFARVLRPEGSLLVVVPRESHLIELRSELPLLHIDEDKQERVVEQFANRFQLAAQETLQYRVSVETQDVLDFLYMTPNYWHLDEATKLRASRLGVFDMTMSLSILRFALSPRPT